MEYLVDVPVSVRHDGHIYFVEYNDGVNTGECIYEYGGVGKSGKILVMTSCRMDDIIEGVNSRKPLMDGDFYGLSMYIREHSLWQVMEYIDKYSKE